MVRNLAMDRQSIVSLPFNGKPEGGIEFWQVIQQPQLKLQRTGYVIDLDRGVHQVLGAR